MKRILHIIGKMDRAGAETMIMNLYRTINRNEIQFDFVVFSSQKGDYDDEIRSLGGYIYPIVKSNAIKRMFALKQLLLTHPEYQIVHSHTLFSNSFHIWAAQMTKVPFRIAHAHNTNDLFNEGIIGWAYKTFAIIIIAKKATHFIACGKAAGKFLFPYQKKVLILPNAINTGYFADMGHTQKDYLKDFYQADENCLKIMQIGRLLSVKNHFFSVQIALELKKRHVNFKMFFAGQGDLHDALKKKIEMENLEDEVIFLGVRSDVPQLLAGADVLLMPSLHEGFPMVMVEAQAAGIPSLIADSISAEVNLEVELVMFESLKNDAERWADKLISLKTKRKISTEFRLKKLKEQGYDILDSAKVLTDLYNSMT